MARPPAAKRPGTNRMLQDVADLTIRKIGGAQKVADVVVEGLSSQNSNVRTKALSTTLDLVKQGVMHDVAPDEMADSDIEDELDAYVGRFLVELDERDYVAFIERVALRRSARKEAMERLETNRKRQVAAADDLILPSV